MNKLIRLLILSIFTLITSMLSYAYEIKGGKIEWVNDNKGTAGLEFILEEGWHIFWEHPGAVGIATEVTVSQGDKSEKLINLWPAPQSFMVGPLEGWGYEKETIIPMGFPSWVNPDIPFRLNVAGQICKDICIPFTIEDDIKPGFQGTFDQIAKLNQAVVNLPLPASSKIQASALFEPSLDNSDIAMLEVSIDNPRGFIQPQLFESNQKNLGYISKNVILKNNNQNAIFVFEVSGLKFEPDALLEKDLKLTIVDGTETYYLSASVEKGVIKTKETIPLSIMIIIQALLVGLIFNIMPCVLPVLGIKLGTIVGLAGAEKKEVRLRFILTALGIIIAFLALAIMFVIAKQFGAYMGWGTYFQQPLFIVFMTIIVAIFASSLFGLWTLNQLSIETKSTKTSMLGEVGSGILATILATPCTVPFMAPVAAFAFASSTINLFMIFLFIGFGMALPWLMVALFPQTISILPKPGKWMLYVKHFFGVLLLATLFWLLWVLYSQILFNIWILILIAVILIFIIFIVTRRSISAMKWLFICILSLSMLVIVSFTGNNEKPIMVQNSQRGKLEGKIFSQQELVNVLQKGAKVLVIGTADWCITCKVNEKRVLNREHIAQKLKENNIITLIADMTKDNAEGQAWMQKLNRYGLPLTVYYRSLDDFDILPTFLSEDDILNLL